MKKGIDFCKRCKSKSLFDTQDENGEFITVCNDCGHIQQRRPYGVYIYRGEVITLYCGGWMGRAGDFNIYKTVDDCKNAIDKYLGGFSGRCIPKRHGKPIRIIGQFKDE